MLKEKKNTMINRPLILTWIATLFARELTLDDVESYRNGKGRVLLDTIAGEIPEAVELERMRSILQGPGTSEDTVLDLAGAFSWLFHGVGGPKAAPTHWHDWSEESDGSQMNCIDTCAELMSRCDLGPALESDESADHVSVQLEFLGYLEARSASDPDGPWSEYHDQLVRDQIDAWLPYFLTACERNDRNGFYAALASFTRRVLSDSLTGSANSIHAAHAA
nr:molecular chaperone TorD family protein [uncultured Pseudodesulfovibrio sp.]